MSLITVWLLAPFVGAGIAAFKKRSVIIHFLLTFLLSPLWVIVIALAEGFKVCPKCSAKIKKRLMVCSNCKYEF